MLPNRYIVAMVVLAITFTAGWRISSWRCQAAQARAIADAMGETARQMQADTKAALQAAQTSEHVRVVYRTIREEVQHANVTDCGLGPDFVGVWNRASQAAAQSPAR